LRAAVSAAFRRAIIISNFLKGPHQDNSFAPPGARGIISVALIAFGAMARFKRE
jgi:hypothetical protein